MCFLKEKCKCKDIVTLYSRHLWSDVVWGTTERACGAVTCHAFLTHAEVRQLDVSVVIQQHVVQL